MTSRRREPRQSVKIVVRLVTDRGWADAEIRDVSSGGVMAICQSPPERGTYVEVRRESYSIVGRVVWSSDGRFGIQAQQKVDLSDLTQARARVHFAMGDRRQAVRPKPTLQPRRTTIQERTEASRRHARAMEFVAVSAVALLLVYLVVDQVRIRFAQPLEIVSATLRAAESREGG
jgi:hypothetical protein